MEKTKKCSTILYKEMSDTWLKCGANSTSLATKGGSAGVSILPLTHRSKRLEHCLLYIDFRVLFNSRVFLIHEYSLIHPRDAPTAMRKNRDDGKFPLQDDGDHFADIKTRKLQDEELITPDFYLQSKR